MDDNTDVKMDDKEEDLLVCQKEKVQLIEPTNKNKVSLIRASTLVYLLFLAYPKPKHHEPITYFVLTMTFVVFQIACKSLSKT
jgi:hypothetical protein